MSHSTAKPLSWSRDNFLISTSPDLIQPQAVKAAFDSDFMYWTKPMSEEGFATMIANSLCFGVYETITATSSPAAEQTDSDSPVPVTGKQVGFSRLVTDRVTMAYLTDVYILPEYQGRGLSTWMLRCLQEMLDSWPELRGSILYADDGKAVKVYGELMGVQPWVQGTNGLVICTRQFEGSGLEHGRVRSEAQQET